MELQLVRRLATKRAVVHHLLLAFLCAACLLAPTKSALGNDLDDIRAVQAKIQQVVTDCTGVSVVVTDGIGFGSGVIVSKDGLVLTAGHVLATGGSNVRVIFPDGREVKARPLGQNLNVDAGMVQMLEPGPWPHAKLGKMSEVRRGDWCVCLGHSGGYELGRQPPVRAGRILDFEPDQVVTDCVLIGGDSGGPLFDLQGRVIGIHSSIGSSIAENRHVSVSTFRRHWARLAKGESWGILPELDSRQPKRPAVGIRVDRSVNRALITKVHSGGPAEKAGLAAGDVIVEFNGIVVSNSDMLIDLIKQQHPGETVSIIALRGEERLKLSIKIGQN